MRSVRLFEIDDCAAEGVVEAKAGRTISVCIPCRDEAATVGPLISTIRNELMRRVPLVDELIVLDDRSTDDTASVAAGAMAQNVYLYCASAGLSTVIRAWFDRGALAQAMGLDADNEVLLAQTVGMPKTATGA